MSAETEAEIHAALTRHLVTEGLVADGEFVGDWITNVYLPSVDRTGYSAYALVMSGGELPDHTAIGLLTNALDRVRGISGDDDE